MFNVVPRNYPLITTKYFGDEEEQGGSHRNPNFNYVRQNKLSYVLMAPPEAEKRVMPPPLKDCMKINMGEPCTFETRR